MRLKLSINAILIHLFWWLILFLFFCGVNSINTNYGMLFWMSNTYYTYVIAIPTAYFVVFFLFPKLLFKKKFIQFSVFFIFSLFAAILITRVLYFYIILPIKWPEALLNTTFWGFSILNGASSKFLIIGILAIVELIKKWLKEQKEKKEIEKDKLSNELKLIKSQLSPHFLFNTLNNIDSLIYQDPKRASGAVVKLSELLRYVLYEASEDRVKLIDELNFISNILDLQKLRIESNDDIVFTIEGEARDKTIAPMLLTPLIENMFKHGSQIGETPLFFISVKISENRLFFYCKNYLREKKNIDLQSGIGLKNVKKQLDLLYKDNYTFETEETDKEFFVKLKIELSSPMII